MGRYAATVPVSVVYMLTLSLTSLSLGNVPAGLRHRLLLAQSTNLHHLERDPFRVIVASAFWLSRAWQLPLALVACLLLTWVERRFGSRLWAATFAIGHVLATLVIVAGIWLGLKAGIGNPRLAHARDVGPSYGLAAVAAVMTFALPRRWQRWYAAVLVGVVSVAAVVSQDFTAFGHLTAVALGFAVAFCARGRLRAAV